MTQTFRHQRGGGVIVGIAPAVGSDCFIDASCIIEGRSRISWGSRIRNDSAVKDSEVVISTLDRTIAIGSHVAYARVRDSILDHAIVRGADDPALVEHSSLAGGVVVEGVKVFNVELDGPYTLDFDCQGTPRHYLLESANGQIRLGIVDCGNGEAGIGCKRRPIAEWIEKKELDRRLFVKKHGWTGYEPDEIHELFIDWMS
jgi:hypothetical protein